MDRLRAIPPLNKPKSLSIRKKSSPAKRAHYVEKKSTRSRSSTTRASKKTKGATKSSIQRVSKKAKAPTASERRAKRSRLLKELDIGEESSSSSPSPKKKTAKKPEPEREFDIPGANSLIKRCFPLVGLEMMKWKADQAAGINLDQPAPRCWAGNASWSYDYLNSLSDGGILAESDSDSDDD